VKRALSMVFVGALAGCAEIFPAPADTPPPPEPSCTFDHHEVCPAKCDGGDPSACETLARVALMAHHGDRGEATSLALFQRACDLGDKRSCELVDLGKRDRQYVGWSDADRACEPTPHGWDANGCKAALDRWRSVCPPTTTTTENCHVDSLESSTAHHICVDGSIDDCDRGCDAGLWTACRELAEIYYRGGSKVASDRGRFVSILYRACGDGDAESCQQLGRYYAPRGCPPEASCIQVGGTGDTPNDPAMSAHYYELACRLAGRGCDDLLELERDKWLELPLGVSSFAWEKLTEERSRTRR
jgi:TPR repeat protein